MWSASIPTRRVVYWPVEKRSVWKIPTPVNNRATQKRPWELIELWWHLDSPTRKTHFPYVFEGFKARVSRVSSKRVALGELSSEFELWRPKELTPGVERSTAGRFSFLGRKSQRFVGFLGSGRPTRCDLCSKRDFWSASETFKVAPESAENRSRTL